VRSEEWVFDWDGKKYNKIKIKSNIFPK